MPLVLFRSSITHECAVVITWQWWRLMKRLSMCTSLSGVRPTITRPTRSGISWMVRPSVATSRRASAERPRAVLVLDPAQLLDRAGDVGLGDRVAVGGEGRHHRRVAQGVDEPRHAAAVAEDLRVGVGGEQLAVGRPRDL